MSHLTIRPPLIPFTQSDTSKWAVCLSSLCQNKSSGDSNSHLSPCRGNTRENWSCDTGTKTKECVSQLRSYLGLISYHHKFIPIITTLHPLTVLLHTVQYPLLHIEEMFTGMRTEVLNTYMQTIPSPSGTVVWYLDDKPRAEKFVMMEGQWERRRCTTGSLCDCTGKLDVSTKC